MIHLISVIHPSNLGVREAFVQHLINIIMRIRHWGSSLTLPFSLIVIPLLPLDGLQGQAGPRSRHLFDLGSDGGCCGDRGGVLPPTSLLLDDVVIRISLSDNLKLDWGGAA